MAAPGREGADVETPVRLIDVQLVEGYDGSIVTKHVDPTSDVVLKPPRLLEQVRQRVQIEQRHDPGGAPEWLLSHGFDVRRHRAGVIEGHDDRYELFGSRGEVAKPRQVDRVSAKRLDRTGRLPLGLGEQVDKVALDAVFRASASRFGERSGLALHDVHGRI